MLEREQAKILAAVMIHGVPIAEAVGISSRPAKIRASERALGVIRKLRPAEFRTKYGCDCRVHSEGTIDVLGTAV